MTSPTDFQAMDGRKVPLRMSVEYISFSAHVDFAQNSQFIDDVKAPHVVSVQIKAYRMTVNIKRVPRFWCMVKPMQCIV